MNRLQSELHRLYGTAHAAVLSLARPADWQALSPLWRGVQADLGLPAPAIAIDGEGGFQLWFSFAEGGPPEQALAFLEALRARYLDGIAPARIGMTAAAEALPPRQVQADRWSAFIAPDLAPLFADEPWLDTPPGHEGQADLLQRLAPIKDAARQAALQLLAATARSSTDAAATATTAPALPTAPPPAPSPRGADLDPRRFLQDVLNDETLALGLRIEAAKALLR